MHINNSPVNLREAYGLRPTFLIPIAELDTLLLFTLANTLYRKCYVFFNIPSRLYLGTSTIYTHLFQVPVIRVKVGEWIPSWKTLSELSFEQYRKLNLRKA